MEKKIIVSTQKELDKIKIDFNGEIIIIGGTIEIPINLTKLYKSATVILNGNACINMWGNSQVNYMWENSQVNYMRGNSQVNYMRENSQVNYMRENSQVKEMMGNSQVKEMRGNSLITKLLSKYNKINCYGYNYVFVSNEISDYSNIILNNTSQIIKFNTFQTMNNIEFYLKNYDIKKTDDGKSLIFFKAVHKKNNEDGTITYFSNHDKNFTYSIGEVKHHECDSDDSNSCRVGMHVSDLEFAKRFCMDWLDSAILELIIPIDCIVVAKDCDGKVRCSDLTVIRELAKSEYES